LSVGKWVIALEEKTTSSMARHEWNILRWQRMQKMHFKTMSLLSPCLGLRKIFKASLNGFY
jgi:hypothetical protein